MKYSLVIMALVATAAAKDGDADANKNKDKTTEAPKCALTKFEVFKKEGCAAADLNAEVKEAALTTLKAGFKASACAAAGDKWTQTTCDAKGISTQKYSEEGCKAGKEDGDATTVIEWGKCTAAGDSWVKVSGAKAVMASAAVALAFVGSQF